MLESLYVIERDGWKLFLLQSGFDETRFNVSPLGEHWMLAYMDEHATAQSEVEAAVEWMLGRVDSQQDELERPPKLITPKSIANGWHQLVEELTAV